MKTETHPTDATSGVAGFDLTAMIPAELRAEAGALLAELRTTIEALRPLMERAHAMNARCVGIGDAVYRQVREADVELSYEAREGLQRFVAETSHGGEIHDALLLLGEMVDPDAHLFNQ